MRYVWFLAQLTAGYGLVAWSWHLGRASVAPSGVDAALGVLWRLVPLAAVMALLVYAGGLLWLDYCRRSAQTNLPSGDFPSEEGITTPSGKVGR